ncbi:hypothetical protein BKA70DRAFT_1417888 [Coprinopsis sp. MPI-PUGE-AT-0042]|nr:hypothetical protein BKA70DRAFT_1417888 [Coprinopsis sp. MPI-PUGE-AT-0042]
MSVAEETSEPNDAAIPTSEPTGDAPNQPEGPSDVEVIDLTGLSSGSEEEDLDDNDDGSESEVEIQLNAETREQLRQAISTVSETRLRQVLANLLETDQAVEIALAREFITVQRETQKVIVRWYRCIQCDEEFDGNTLREDDECAFHPGDLEIDPEGFVDWDEACHGPMDTSENRLEYPQEFKWSCCEEDGSSRGCVQGQHKPMEVTKKRKRGE